jgi:hypothetical protein
LSFFKSIIKNDLKDVVIFINTNDSISDVENALNSHDSEFLEKLKDLILKKNQIIEFNFDQQPFKNTLSVFKKK